MMNKTKNQRCPFKVGSDGRGLPCEGADCAAWDDAVQECFLIQICLQKLGGGRFEKSSMTVRKGLTT
ncbi:MAG: hypothetical protein KAH44_13625 [Oricola sp.]|nr:hypothetical protein [Oricola sp.]